MASFRLVRPDGETESITEGRDVALGEQATLRISIDEASYTLGNSGTVAVTLYDATGPSELPPGEERECASDVAFGHDGSRYRVEMTGVAKRRRREASRHVAFGYQLYRLRTGPASEAAEANVATWFEGEVEYACLSNYMVDLDWLLSAVPSLATVPKILLIHGEARSDAHLTTAKERHNLEQLTLHRPPLPIPFGTHHSKACFLKFPTGLRVVVHTANLIYTDCGNKTQGAWVQDFPKKTEDSESGSEFEADLLHYLRALKLPTSERKLLFEHIEAHDFSLARVKLITSVPGYHMGRDMGLYGHLALRNCLQKEKFSAAFKEAPVVCQFSSLGSLDEKWLYNEFVVSLSGGRTEEGVRLGSPAEDGTGLQLIWPTADQVRGSLEGWGAGASIPGSMKNVQKPFLQKHWHKFDGTHLQRQRAMPHIKTYGRYADSTLAWVVLASHNLSKAAWGTLQRNGSQFQIRSYELGVLFLPSLERRFQDSPLRHFSCGPPSAASTPVPKDIAFVPFPVSEGDEVQEESMFVQFPLPFGLPPVPYDTGDVPWQSDAPFKGVDALGRRRSNREPMYGKLESDSVI